LLVSHIKRKNNLKAWDGGKPRELLCLALNQCLSSQDVIVIPQQVAMEKSLIGAQTESTITRCPKKGRGSSERLAAAISGRVVTVAALAKAGARRAGMQIRL